MPSLEHFRETFIENDTTNHIPYSIPLRHLNKERKTERFP
jgi:hypothetical protein